MYLPVTNVPFPQNFADPLARRSERLTRTSQSTAPAILMKSPVACHSRKILQKRDRVRRCRRPTKNRHMYVNIITENFVFFFFFLNRNLTFFSSSSYFFRVYNNKYFPLTCVQPVCDYYYIWRDYLWIFLVNLIRVSFFVNITSWNRSIILFKMLNFNVQYQLYWLFTQIFKFWFENRF